MKSFALTLALFLMFTHGGASRVLGKDVGKEGDPKASSVAQTPSRLAKPKAATVEGSKPPVKSSEARQEKVLGTPLAAPASRNLQDEGEKRACENVRRQRPKERPRS